MEQLGDAGVPMKHRSMQRPVASVNHARVDGPPGAMPRAIPSHTLGVRRHVLCVTHAPRVEPPGRCSGGIGQPYLSAIT
jgi:hypothetical protein